MIKGIFLTEKLDKERLQTIVNLGGDTVFVGYQNLDQKDCRVDKRERNLKIFTEVR